jgi:hypothetical protein
MIFIVIKNFDFLYIIKKNKKKFIFSIYLYIIYKL